MHFEQNDDENEETFRKYLDTVDGSKKIEAYIKKNLSLTGYKTNAELDEISDLELKDPVKRGY